MTAEVFVIDGTAAPADALSGTFTLPGSGAFGVTGFGPVSDLAEGATPELAGTITFDPLNNPGASSETILFHADRRPAGGDADDHGGRACGVDESAPRSTCSRRRSRSARSMSAARWRRR